MKKRYVFIRDASICPTGVAQDCPESKKKLFKKGTIVWGTVYENAVQGDKQGYALDVEENGGWNHGGQNWDVPLPPLDNSPVVPAPILLSKGAIIIYLIIIIALYVKYKR